MKKKYRIKKKNILFTIIILIITISISFNALKTKNYTKYYEINNVAIKETYLKEKKLYYFELNYDQTKYNFVVNRRYSKDRELIKKINKEKDGKYVCLFVKSDFFEIHPLCSNDKQQIDYHITTKKLGSLIKKEKLISSKKIKNKKYNISYLYNDLYIWNYKGYDYVSKEEIEKIELFKKDIYNTSLSTIIDNYLFIPNYNQKYNYNSVYLVNLKNNKVKEWKLDYEISFESYILGNIDESLFIMDKKNKIEYELVPSKQKMRIVGTEKKGGIYYKDNKKISISIASLLKDEQPFAMNYTYNYEINNNTLYLKYLDSNIKTKISQKKVNKIINIYNDEVYYLVKDTVYFYNIKYGETKIIENKEWKYNNDNILLVKNNN